MNWTYRTDTDTIVNGYRFTYDAHDRLASAYSVTGSDFSSGRYHVEYEYDKHGNMVNLYRNGGRGGMIDEMNWSYEGNRVVEITDMMGEQGRYDMKEYRDYNYNGLDYFYDPNGNMTADLDRDIVAIRYNLLNQPDTVQFRNGSAIVNYYTADGKRTGSKYLTPLTTVVIPAGQTFGSTSGTAAMSSHVTARRGSLEYAGADFESDTLIRIHNGDGYLDCSEQDFRYFVRDYQGNIRTVYGSAVAKLTPVEPPFSSTNRGPIGGDKPPIRPKPIEHTVTYQRMQYYPFGLPYEVHYQPEEQPYKYGGKEFIELHGYDSYDFDARMYYPALCRFMTMDPLCEKYYSISPYAYCNNNPVKYVDPDGKFLQFAENVSKEFKEYFKIAVEYLNQHNAAGKMADLHASNETYYIAESFDGHYYSPKSRTIKWAPKLGLLTNELVELSPSTLLNHEIDHAWRHDKGPQGQRQDREKPSQYGNKEEERVITGYERQTAIALEEIESGQVTRLDHEGTPHTTSGPTQRDWFYQK